MDEFINITSSVQQPKQKSVEQLLELINKNVNRKGTEQNKRLDIIEKDSTKILKAITKLNTRQEKEDAKKAKDDKKEMKLRDKWSKFLDKAQGFFDTISDKMYQKFGVFGKVFSAPIKLLSKSLSLVKFKKKSSKEKPKDTDGVKSQQESKEDAKKAKSASAWAKFRAVVGKGLELIGKKLSIKERFQAAKEKLNNFGLIGKTIKKVLDFIPFLIKIVPLIFSGIGKFFIGLFKVVGSVLGWPALIIAAVAAIGILLYKNWDAVKEAFGDFFDWLCDIPSQLWKYVRSLLPSWLGGMSDEEKEQYEKDSATKDELKKKGVKRADRNAYIEEQEKRRKAGLDEQSYDEWQSKRVLSGERKGAVVADSKEARQLAREQANKKMANVIKQAETSSAKPEKIEQPETPESDSSKKEQPKAVEKTVIIKETQSGAEVADYIGTASSVVLNMTRT